MSKIDSIIGLNQNDLLNLSMLNEITSHDGLMGTTKISSNLKNLNQILMRKNEKFEKYFDKKYNHVLTKITTQQQNSPTRVIPNHAKKIEIILNEITKKDNLKSHRQQKEDPLKKILIGRSFVRDKFENFKNNIQSAQQIQIDRQKINPTKNQHYTIQIGLQKIRAKKYQQEKSLYFLQSIQPISNQEFVDSRINLSSTFNKKVLINQLIKQYWSKNNQLQFQKLIQVTNKQNYRLVKDEIYLKFIIDFRKMIKLAKNEGALTLTQRQQLESKSKEVIYANKKMIIEKTQTDSAIIKKPDQVLIKKTESDLTKQFTKFLNIYYDKNIKIQAISLLMLKRNYHNDYTANAQLLKINAEARCREEILHARFINIQKPDQHDTSQNLIFWCQCLMLFFAECLLPHHISFVDQNASQLLKKLKSKNSTLTNKIQRSYKYSLSSGISQLWQGFIKQINSDDRSSQSLQLFMLKQTKTYKINIYFKILVELLFHQYDTTYEKQLLNQSQLDIILMLRVLYENQFAFDVQEQDISSTKRLYKKRKIDIDSELKNAYKSNISLQKNPNLKDITKNLVYISAIDQTYKFIVNEKCSSSLQKIFFIDNLFQNQKIIMLSEINQEQWINILCQQLLSFAPNIKKNQSNFYVNIIRKILYKYHKYMSRQFLERFLIMTFCSNESLVQQLFSLSIQNICNLVSQQTMDLNILQKIVFKSIQIYKNQQFIIKKLFAFKISTETLNRKIARTYFDLSMTAINYQTDKIRRNMIKKYNQPRQTGNILPNSSLVIEQKPIQRLVIEQGPVQRLVIEQRPAQRIQIKVNPFMLNKTTTSTIAGTIKEKTTLKTQLSVNQSIISQKQQRNEEKLVQKQMIKNYLFKIGLKALNQLLVDFQINALHYTQLQIFKANFTSYYYRVIQQLCQAEKHFSQESDQKLLYNNNFSRDFMRQIQTLLNVSRFLFQVIDIKLLIQQTNIVPSYSLQNWIKQYLQIRNTGTYKLGQLYQDVMKSIKIYKVQNVFELFTQNLINLCVRSEADHKFQGRVMRSNNFVSEAHGLIKSLFILLRQKYQPASDRLLFLEDRFYRNM